MRKLFAWLDVEVPAKQLPVWIFCFCMGFLLYGELIEYVFQILHLPAESGIGISGDIFTLSFVWERIRSVATEELKFRAPLVLPWLVLKKSKVLSMLTAVVLSIFFAMIHGSDLFNFAFQGVGGLFLCLMFLKFGGTKGKFIKAIGATTAAHFCYNILVSIIGYWL